MSGTSDWYNGIVQKVDNLQSSLRPKDRKWYKFVDETQDTRWEPLLSVARRIDQFSPDCTQCQIFRGDIYTLVTNAPETGQQGDKGLVKSFLKDVDQTVNKIGRHFEKEHNLVNGGYYADLFFYLGLFIGVIIDALLLFVSSRESFFHYFYWGPLTGMGVGWVTGAFLDNKAKREDRVLFEKPPSDYSRYNPISSIIFLATMLIMGLIAWFMLR